MTNKPTFQELIKLLESIYTEETLTDIKNTSAYGVAREHIDNVCARMINHIAQQKLDK